MRMVLQSHSAVWSAEKEELEETGHLVATQTLECLGGGMPLAELLLDQILRPPHMPISRIVSGRDT